MKSGQGYQRYRNLTFDPSDLDLPKMNPSLVFLKSSLTCEPNLATIGARTWEEQQGKQTLSYIDIQIQVYSFSIQTTFGFEYNLAYTCIYSNPNSIIFSTIGACTLCTVTQINHFPELKMDYIYYLCNLLYLLYIFNVFTRKSN